MTWADVILQDLEEKPAPAKRPRMHPKDLNDRKKAICEERRKKVFLLIQRGYAHINLLQQFFPENDARTIRRDIDDLIERNMVKRHNRSYLVPETQIFISALVEGTKLAPRKKPGRKPMDRDFLEKCIIDAIRAGSKTYTEIRRTSGLTSTQTRDVLDALVKKGTVRENFDSKWGVGKRPRYELVKA